MREENIVDRKGKMKEDIFARQRGPTEDVHLVRFFVSWSELRHTIDFRPAVFVYSNRRSGCIQIREM
jgi:hypothetical protein